MTEKDRGYTLADAVRNLPIPHTGDPLLAEYYDSALSAASDFVRQRGARPAPGQRERAESAVVALLKQRDYPTPAAIVDAVLSALPGAAASGREDAELRKVAIHAAAVMVREACGMEDEAQAERLRLAAVTLRSAIDSFWRARSAPLPGGQAAGDELSQAIARIDGGETLGGKPLARAGAGASEPSEAERRGLVKAKCEPCNGDGCRLCFGEGWVWAERGAASGDTGASHE